MNPNKTVVVSLADLEAASVATADLGAATYQIAGDACCDQCCDDYVCTSE